MHEDSEGREPKFGRPAPEPVTAQGAWPGAPLRGPVSEERLLMRVPQSPVTSVRSTLIQSSLQTLRKRSLGDRYVRLLAPEHHEVVLNTLEPTWLPIDAAMAHYSACEALGLSEAEQLDMGNAVGERVQGTFLMTLARTGKHLGVTPWIIIANLERLWDRTFQGGGCAAYKVSPKDARIELLGLPIASIPYFRNAYRGVFLTGTSLFAQRAFCTFLARHSGPSALCYKLSWA